MKISKIAFRNINRNMRRSILSGTAIAFATMVIVLMFSLVGGMLADMEWNITSYITGHIQIRNAEYEKYEMFNPMHLNIKDSGQLISELESLDETSIVAPRINFPGLVYRGEDTFRMQGVGADLEKEVRFQNLSEHILAGSIPKPGTTGVIMGYQLAKDMGLGIGDKFTLLTSTVYRGSNGMTFTVEGLMNFVVSGMNSTTFLAPVDTVQKLVKSGDAVTEILVKVPEDTGLKQAADSVRNYLAKTNRTDLSAKSFNELSTSYAWIEMAQSIYDVFALVFFILASTVIINTTMMVIFERMKEIGTIGAMGMTGREIQRLFFLEAFFIGIIGAFIGAILGSILTSLLARTGIDLSGAMEGIEFEISAIIYPKLSFRSTVFVYIYAVVVSSLATILPTRKAAHIEPVEALRST